MANEGRSSTRVRRLTQTVRLSATLWYHDHALGITRLNVYAGLAGFYLIRDQTEKALNLPRDEFEIPLMLQDRLFNRDGSLYYPKVLNGPKEHPIWIQEFYGDLICVNGKVTPFLEVEPRKYRFRILNAANSRFYHLRLFNSDAGGEVINQSFEVPSFDQIGTDSGNPVHRIEDSPEIARLRRITPFPTPASLRLAERRKETSSFCDAYSGCSPPDGY